MSNIRLKIAEAFSHGKFDTAIPYLSDQIIWNVVGENIFEGKDAVVTNCNQTAEYFKRVETDFKTRDIIAMENKVVVRGTGEFKRDGKQVNLMSACDVYEFNNKNELKAIFSYCIRE